MIKAQNYFLKFNSSKAGLTEHRVSENRQKFGKNVFTTKKRDSFFEIVLHQLGGFFSVLLFSAAAILLFLGDRLDAYIILVVVFINVGIESVQRYRSDSIFEKINESVPVYSLVLRDNQKTKIESADIVAGDIVVLSAGDRVPADGLVFYAQDFKVDEAILTGESQPVSKNADSQEYNLESIIDNPNGVFSGSYVVTGEAHAMVARVGNDTQLGQIAHKVSLIDSELPLQKNIKKLSAFIFMFVLGFSILALVIGLVQERPATEIFTTTVALFVSAIPESLSLMFTLVLAYGFKRMSDKHVLVRNMQSLDVLGRIDTLAVDKTGTVTSNQMKIEKLYVSGRDLYVTGSGYDPDGQVVLQDKPVEASEVSGLNELATAVTLGAMGAFGFDSKTGRWELHHGDPTEVAMLVLGQKLGMGKETLEAEYVLKENITFNSQKMYHETVYLKGKKEVRFFSGAPEVVLNMVDHVLIDGVHKRMTDAMHDTLKKKVSEYASGGYRVLGLFVGEGSKNTFLGLIAMSDSIKEDVYRSVEQVCKRGINMIMITGDHVDVALQTAKKIGMKCSALTVLNGEDMRNLNENQLRNVVLQKNVFARMTPQQKLKILEILKAKGKVVAMTGDGVNDALALLKADIGISMGKNSTEVAKEASDIVLMDDSFGTIVYGVEEGKNILANLKKTIVFLLSTNFSEMFVVVLAILFALPIPLSAAAILWLNLVTDTFLVLGFAFETAHAKRHDRGELLSSRDWGRILYLGFVMTAVALFSFFKWQHVGMLYAQGVTLLVLIMMQWFNLLNIRAGSKSVFSRSFYPNKAFVIGWVCSLFLTILAFTTPFLHRVLDIQPISLADWLYAFLLSSSILWCEELRKFARKIRLFSSKKILDFS